MFIYRVNDDIILRLPAITDAPALHALFEKHRDHLAEWQDWADRMRTLADCEKFILRHRREYAEGDTLGCFIFYQDVLVGMVELYRIVPFLRKAEIGYWLAEDYQGEGIITQSCQHLIAYAFDSLNLNRLALKYKRVSDDHENVRSRKVAERLGFSREGVLRDDGMTKGQLMDMVMYSLLADEWRAMHK